MSARFPSHSANGPDGEIRVTAPVKQAFLDDLETRLSRRQGFAVATINLDHAVKLTRDPAFAAAYRQQTHVTADGNPIVWLSRLAGHRVELMPGSELIEPVARIAARTGTPVALVGATEAALEGAADALVARAPGLTVAAKIAPPMGFDPAGPAADAVIEDLRASGAGLVFLALGAPKQEIFAARALAALPHAGFLSIGAGLDFLAGTQTRAPEWVRKLAAEWIWRMALSPRRLVGRYASCVAVLPGLTASALKDRWSAR